MTDYYRRNKKEYSKKTVLSEKLCKLFVQDPNYGHDQENKHCSKINA